MERKAHRISQFIVQTHTQGREMGVKLELSKCTRNLDLFSYNLSILSHHLLHFEHFISRVSLFELSNSLFVILLIHLKRVENEMFFEINFARKSSTVPCLMHVKRKFYVCCKRVFEIDKFISNLTASVSHAF